MSEEPATLRVAIYVASDTLLLSPDEARDLYAQLGDLLGMTGAGVSTSGKWQLWRDAAMEARAQLFDANRRLAKTEAPQ